VRIPRPPARCAGRDPERGSALVEFVGVTVVLLLPLLYLLLTVFAIQRAAFAVDEGARDAGRALTLAGSTPVGMTRAAIAAQIALDDQGVTGPPDLRVTRNGCAPSVPGIVPVLTPGARYDVCLSVRVPLPFTGDRVLGHVAPAGITVSGEYVLVVSPFGAGS
jgi:hypothetical protein